MSFDEFWREHGLKIKAPIEEQRKIWIAGQKSVLEMLPEKVDTSRHFAQNTIDYLDGFNACIDHITNTISEGEK